MTHHSEDRIEEARHDAPPRSARILPFERPQSELQRAIQQRAQETMDIERDREREANKPAPLKWLIIFLAALIPVVLIFGAVDGFLRAFYRVNEMLQNAPPPAQSAPQETEAPTVSDTPGVIILQPYDAPRGESASPAQEQPSGGGSPPDEGQ